MTDRYILLKLTTGESVIGNLMQSESEIVISYPMSVSTFPLLDKNGKMCGGTVILKNWIEGCADTEVTIPRAFVLDTSVPDLDIIDEYTKVKSMEIKARKEIKKIFNNRKKSALDKPSKTRKPKKDNKASPKRIGGKINLDIDHLLGDLFSID